MFLFDPLQLYHKPIMRETVFYDDMRPQAAGIIRHYDFDSIILGTSMTENMSAASASQLLGGEFVNISISGGHCKGRRHLLDYTIQHKVLKHVIYSLDFMPINHPEEYNPDYPPSSYTFLYDDNPFNDFKIYRQHRYMKCLVIWSSHCISKITELENATEWFSSRYNQKRFGGIDNWLKAADPHLYETYFAQIINAVEHINKSSDMTFDQNLFAALAKRHQANFDENLLEVIKAHPDTQFHLVLPPYSRLRYALWAQTEPLQHALYQAHVRHAVAQSAKFDNITIFGFSDQDFPDDLALYKDTKHYHRDIDQMILASIAARKHILTPDNVNTYLTNTQNRAIAFDLKDLAAYMKTYLETHHGALQ